MTLPISLCTLLRHRSNIYLDLRLSYHSRLPTRYDGEIFCVSLLSQEREVTCPAFLLWLGEPSSGPCYLYSSTEYAVDVNMTKYAILCYIGADERHRVHLTSVVI